MYVRVRAFVCVRERESVCVYECVCLSVLGRVCINVDVRIRSLKNGERGSCCTWANAIVDLLVFAIFLLLGRDNGKEPLSSFTGLVHLVSVRFK